MSGLCIGPIRYFNERFDHFEANGNLSNAHLSTMKKILLISALVFCVAISTSHCLTYWNIPQAYQWTLTPFWFGSIIGLCWSAGWINDHLNLSLLARLSR
jgi:hypothetical protein